jgi:gamma-glutamyltranspeptidase/glutathione hydrolase
LARAAIRATSCLTLLVLAAASSGRAGSTPTVARHGMVVSQNAIASEVGARILAEGGGAIDAAVAVAFALAVVHPTAGNIGGGGFLLYRPAEGEAIAYDFRETAPTGAYPEMFLSEGRYDAERHHHGHLSVGVPGTVAGLRMAWEDHGRLPWARLVQPAVALARDGFTVTYGLERSLLGVLDDMKRRGYAASVAQLSRHGEPFRMGDTLRQPDLARTLGRIAEEGAAGFYQGETARLIEAEMKANGGRITRQDLAAYQARRRVPARGSYRGYQVLSMPPPSSGGTALLEMLNVLEGYDLGASGWGSARTIHLVAETMRRAFADRALHLGDPDFNPEIPSERLTSKDYAAELRASIDPDRASRSSPDRFDWPAVSPETTHLSVVDAARNACSLTYTLEQGYGSRIVVPGAGFLLNNEMGDFNAGPGLTDADGSIGTPPNLAAPGKRMLSSMTPTILARDGRLFMVIGSPGGRTIINTVLLAILNVVDFGMNIQEAIDAPRFHHQWLPDQIRYERLGFSPDTLDLLRSRGHTLVPGDGQGVAEGIRYQPEDDRLEGGSDRRAPDGAAVGL